MDDKTYSMGGIGFLALFFLIIIAVWNRGGCGGFGWGNNCGNWGFGEGFGPVGYGFQNFKATCDAEKQEIINTARTQYLIEQVGASNREVATANANVTNTKIDFYAYQGLRDQLAETQRALMEANNKLFVKDQLAPITAQLSSIQCQMLKRPDVTGVGAVCPSAAIINGLGVNSLNACGCGCNGLV